jgi:Ni/Co efflux regulator RcnB
MHMFKNKTLVLALFAALATAPALADKGKDGGKDKHGRGADHVRVDRDHDGDKRHHARHDDDRGHHARNCPPGLAKKDNGCRPPGLAKRDDDHRHRLAVGSRIPPGAVYTVPQPVLTTLPPPPVGYRYAVVNQQLVLVSERSDIVVEIIRSLLG